MDEPLVPTILGQQPYRYRVAGILRDYVVASRLTSLSLCHDEWKTNGSTLICLGRGAISNPSFSRRVAREIESEQKLLGELGEEDRSIYLSKTWRENLNRRDGIRNSVVKRAIRTILLIEHRRVGLMNPPAAVQRRHPRATT